MRLQVVHCHPLTSSYNHALFRAIVETLEANGHEVVATDLYREGFNPAMTEHERATYMQESYDHGAVAGYVDTLKSVSSTAPSNGAPTIAAATAATTISRSMSRI